MGFVTNRLGFWRDGGSGINEMIEMDGVSILYIDLGVFGSIVVWHRMCHFDCIMIRYDINNNAVVKTSRSQRCKSVCFIVD